MGKNSSFAVCMCQTHSWWHSTPVAMLGTAWHEASLTECCHILWALNANPGGSRIASCSCPRQFSWLQQTGASPSIRYASCHFKCCYPLLVSQSDFYLVSLCLRIMWYSSVYEFVGGWVLRKSKQDSATTCNSNHHHHHRPAQDQHGHCVYNCMCGHNGWWA